MISFKYKLRPSPLIISRFQKTLDMCRELYNAGLQERKDAYSKRKVSLSYYSQSSELPNVKEARPDIDCVYSQVLQNVLRRLNRSFDNFFRRIENGEKPGYPRFKNESQYNSFTYPQQTPNGGYRLKGKWLYLSKIGKVRVFFSRPIEGKIKTCTIKHEVDGWYVIFTTEELTCPYISKTGKSVGLDVGLTTFATLSTGEKIKNPRFYAKGERCIKTAHRKVNRRRKGSRHRKQAIKLLSRRHKKVVRQRHDFFHKTALDLIRRFDTIVVEDLQIENMVRNRYFARSIFDAAWGTFLTITASKAAKAGKAVVKVNPNGTSQTCICGAAVPKTLKDRWHHCFACGLSLPRDHMSAQVILQRAGAPPAGRDFVGSLVEPRTSSPPSENPVGL